MRLFLILLLLLFTSCSSPQPKNRWQFEASAAQNDYQKHFLQNRILRAKSDLAQSRDFASQSADLHTMIAIELSVCALNISTLKQDPCEKAEALLQIEPNPQQRAYLHLLQKTYSQAEISLLPSSYRSFAKALLDSKDINPALSTISPLSSRALASALVKEEISDKNIQELVERLSYHGYKNPLISWLELQGKKATDPADKEIIEAKLKILTSD